MKDTENRKKEIFKRYDDATEKLKGCYREYMKAKEERQKAFNEIDELSRQSIENILRKQNKRA